MMPIEALGALAELALDDRYQVPSPCISICRMDDKSGLCLGCYRSIDEIVAWGGSSEREKRAVWRLVSQRAGLTLQPSTPGSADETD